MNKIDSKGIFLFLSGIVSGLSFSYFMYKLKKRILNIPTNNNSNMKSPTDNLDQDEINLLKEQLKRNYEFFGDEGMKLITDSFVVVVGIGGVGSHVVMTLIRSGIKRIRVIDYDIVTLSSLNRHAFALRQDVGKLKVRVVKEYASKINPNCIIDTVDDAFTIEYAKKYILEGNPNYIIDCIDDLEAKCGLIKFCQDEKLTIISSMGAGGKNDPTCIKISYFNYVQGDKLAKRMRYLYKKKFNELVPNFKTIFSTEKSTRGLLELEEHQKENPEIYRINENERVRSLPVFASIPAIFGQSIASAVLCDLAKMPLLIEIEEKSIKSNPKTNLNTNFNPNYNNSNSIKEEIVGNVTVRKLYDDFRKSLNLTESSEFELIYEDFVNIAKIFNNSSSISQKSGNKIKFYKWVCNKPPTIDNIVLFSKSEFNKHIDLKSEEELLKFYGETIYYRIDQLLKVIKEEYIKRNII